MRKKVISKIFSSIIFFIILTIILSGAAIFNQYPIITGDSGSYILSGFTPYVPFDRPVIYGLFLVVSSLRSSLWFAVFAQALIVAYVLQFWLTRFSIGRLSRVSIVATILFLAFFTSIAWFTAQI